MLKTNSIALAPTEAARLRDLEMIITKGITTFVEVGQALAEIQSTKLYRATHDTFEAYAKERWNISRPRAYQLVQAAEVTASLSTVVDKPLPERVLRPLAKVKPEERRAVFQKAVALAGDKPVTSKLVEKVIGRKIRKTHRQTLAWRVERAVDLLNVSVDAVEAVAEEAPLSGNYIARVRAEHARLAAILAAAEEASEVPVVPVPAEEPVERWRCSDCEDTHTEDELVRVRECSSDQCGVTFAAIDGNNCPECNRRFTRLVHEHGCPSCGIADECERVAEEDVAAEATS